MTQHDNRDYIGSARVPLSMVWTKGSFVGDIKVKDEQQRICGELRVKIDMTDADEYAQVDLEEQMRLNKAAAQNDEVIFRIAEKIHKDSGDLNLFLDMLFMMDESQQGHVTNAQLRTFLLKDMRDLTKAIPERSLELMLRTHEVFSQKSILLRQDFIEVFGKKIQQIEEMSKKEPVFIRRGKDEPVKDVIKKKKKTLPVSKILDKDRKLMDISLDKINEKLDRDFYDVIQKFKRECNEHVYANKLQTMKVLKTTGSSDIECEAFFERYQNDDMLLYEDVLEALF